MTAASALVIVAMTVIMSVIVAVTVVVTMLMAMAVVMSVIVIMSATATIFVLMLVMMGMCYITMLSMNNMHRNFSFHRIFGIQTSAMLTLRIARLE